MMKSSFSWMVKICTLSLIFNLVSKFKAKYFNFFVAHLQIFWLKKLIVNMKNGKSNSKLKQLL